MLCCKGVFQMQFTDIEIQEILRENEQLKKDIAAAKKELDATGRLYDMMVAGTKNLLILTDAGLRSAVYVSPNVEEVLGLPRELFTPLFAVARCVSWCAHRMEELVNAGPIIRPAYKPIFHPREYVSLDKR